jgi:predicted RNA-binding Zn ribbon-like protein
VAVTIRELPLAVLVELVNGWGGAPRRTGARDTGPYPPIATLDPDGALPDGLTDRALASAADRLHSVFAAADAAARARLVDDLLTTTAVRPAVLADGDALTSGWRVPRRRDRLLAAAAVALRTHLVDHPDRIGVCADDRCADVYVDTSPAGHRRYCSLTCQNRSRIAAYRRKRRTTG